MSAARSMAEKAPFGVCAVARIGSLIACLALAALLAACRDDDPLERAGALTPEGFIERLAEAMTRDDALYHAHGEVSVSPSPTESFGPARTEIWIDPARGAFRYEWRDLRDQSGGVSLSIFVDSVFYELPAGDRKPLVIREHRCPSPAEVVATGVPYPCIGWVFGSEGRVVRAWVEAGATFEGRGAFAFVRESAPNAGSREPSSYVGRVSLYVDPASFLPLETVFELATIDGQSPGFEVRTRYASELVPRETLPAGLFDPRSIGYIEVGEELDVPGLGVPAYWLGRRFDPGGGLPAVALGDVLVPDGLRGGPGFRALVSYGNGGEDAGVRLALWRPEDWEPFLRTPLGRLEIESPCKETREIVLPDRRAMIFLLHEPPWPPVLEPVRAAPPGERPQTPRPSPAPTPMPDPADCPVGKAFDRFIAHIYFDDAVVAMNTALGLCCGGGDQNGFGAYDSLAGLEAVIRDLRVRTPGE